jgi:hypothetical protein
MIASYKICVSYIEKTDSIERLLILCDASPVPQGAGCTSHNISPETTLLSLAADSSKYYITMMEYNICYNRNVDVYRRLL